MRIEECFSLFQKAAVSYDAGCENMSFSLTESDDRDFLLCDIARVIGREKHKNSKMIADIIAAQLPFETSVLNNGDIRFYLWQETKKEV